MNTIDENLINYIEDGDPQNSTVLNRPVKGLVQQLELFEFPSEITQDFGNSETKVMSQKQVTEQLTGWGSENCELPPNGWETSKNGIYWVDQSLHSEVGTPTPSSSEDGVLMVVGKANPQGSDDGEVNQLLFQNGTLRFRTADEQDLNGNIWSHWKTFQVQGELSAGFIGQIISGPFTSVPSGWLELDGSIYNKNDYQELWEFAQNFYLGTEQGSFINNDQNTFRVQDLRGLFIRGEGQYDNDRKSGQLGSVQEDQFKSHNHDFKHSQTDRGDRSNQAWQGNGLTGTTVSTSLVGGSETRPINVAWKYLVRAK